MARSECRWAIAFPALKAPLESAAPDGWTHLRLSLTPPDVLAVVPDRFERGEIAAVENVLRCGEEFAAFRVLPGVVGASGAFGSAKWHPAQALQTV